MSSRLPVIAAALLLTATSCIEINSGLGGDLIPVARTYDIYSVDIPMEEILLKKADSLDARSTTRMAIGSVRDGDGYLTTRGCAVSLVPLFDTLDFGTNPVFKSFHFSAAADSASVADKNQDGILQNVRVYELSEAIDPMFPYDCNAIPAHLSGTITSGTPVINGTDSLSFDFSESFGRRFLSITQAELDDIKVYRKRFPGIYIETDNPIGMGGRIDLYELQLDYDTDYHTIDGNFANLKFESTYDGVKKDTSFIFYFGATYIEDDTDSLLINTTKGSLPQICFNMCGGRSRREGPASEYLYAEGSGGLKPVISAKYMADELAGAIALKGGNPAKAFVNQATMVLPFEFPEDVSTIFRYPEVLCPNVRIHYQDTTGGGSRTCVSYQVLTDYSNENEDKGEIDRFMSHYAPSFTYHMNSLLSLASSDREALEGGDYDVWFLPMANETVTTSSSSSSSDLSDYYQYLAYQSYYNNMYGGYGGYGGYGYGGYGYGSDYYSSYYYNYMLAAMYSSDSSTTTTSLQRDSNRYYLARLNGPGKEDHPFLRVTFSVPKE